DCQSRQRSVAPNPPSRECADSRALVHPMPIPYTDQNPNTTSILKQTLCSSWIASLLLFCLGHGFCHASNHPGDFPLAELFSGFLQSSEDRCPVFQLARENLLHHAAS